MIIHQLFSEKNQLFEEFAWKYHCNVSLELH